MGDPLGRGFLLPYLDHEVWIIRAMAMRYFGELGTGRDYSKLISYLGSQQQDMVYAEMCSSLLRLYGKKVEEDRAKGDKE